MRWWAPYEGEIRLSRWHFAVDTALVRQCPEVVSRLSIKEAYHPTEGAFSCYVDGIAGTIAPSSYSSPEASQKLLSDFSDFERRFRGLEVER